MWTLCDSAVKMITLAFTFRRMSGSNQGSCYSDSVSWRHQQETSAQTHVHVRKYWCDWIGYRWSSATVSIELVCVCVCLYWQSQYNQAWYRHLYWWQQSSALISWFSVVVVMEYMQEPPSSSHGNMWVSHWFSWLLIVQIVLFTGDVCLISLQSLLHVRCSHPSKPRQHVCVLPEDSSGHLWRDPQTGLNPLLQAVWTVRLTTVTLSRSSAEKYTHNWWMSKCGGH